MILNLNDILKTERFAAEAIYGINGRTLGEITMRLQEQQITIDEQKELVSLLLEKLLEKYKENPEEIQDLQKTIEDYYNHERYET